MTHGYTGEFPLGIWNGADDLSGAFSVAWEPSALYVGIKVIDDSHVVTGLVIPEGGYTAGDFVTVQFGLAAEGDYWSDIGGGKMHNVKCYITEPQDSVLRHSGVLIQHSGGTSFSEGHQDGSCVAKRVGTTSSYEIKLSVSAFGFHQADGSWQPIEAFTPGMQLAFATAYMDSDDDVIEQDRGYGDHNSNFIFICFVLKCMRACSGGRPWPAGHLGGRR